MSRATMRRSAQLVAGTVACVLAAGALAAEPDALEARTGLTRVQLSELVGCTGKATNQVSLALGMLAGHTPEQTRAQAEATNQRLQENRRDTPEAIAAMVAEVHAPPRKRLHEYGAAYTAACARQAGIPIDGVLLGRCYSLVSFVNGMLVARLGGDSAGAFAAHWAPELARTPAEVPALQRALHALYEKGAAPPMREVVNYLQCATDPALAKSPLIAPLPPPAEPAAAAGR